MLWTIAVTLSYVCILSGSLGMVAFGLRFPLSSRIKDLELIPERFLGLNGWQLWLGS